MTTPPLALAWIVTMLVGTAVFEAVALLTGGWTISESWWHWAADRPWLNVVLAAGLVALLVHLITGETAPRRDLRTLKETSHVRQVGR